MSISTDTGAPGACPGPEPPDEPAGAGPRDRSASFDGSDLSDLSGVTGRHHARVPLRPGGSHPTRGPESADPTGHLDLDRIEAAIDEAVAALDAANDAQGTGSHEARARFTEAELIDRVAQLQRLRTKVAALQSAEIHEFARAHAASQIEAGHIDPEWLERSIAQQIGLACRTTLFDGRKRMRTGRDLRAGLPRVLALFAAGELNENKADTVAAATAGLDPVERGEVDRLLAEHDICTGMGVRQLGDLVRSLVARVAPERFRARCRAARDDRYVSVRPALDGMAVLTAHLPVEQAVSCAAALEKAWYRIQADPAPLTRRRSQVLADTLVERLTGRVTAEHTDLAVQVLVPVELLVDPDCALPVEIPGHGPVPADLLARAKGRTAWRKLVTRAGVVIGGESRQRSFVGYLADLIRARDRACAAPYCDAPPVQTDHTVRRADGGPTSAGNGHPMCQLHNLLREQYGWNVEPTDDGGTRTTTPTGHRYPAGKA